MNKIVVKNLSFYYGLVLALSDITLNIRANKITALIGPSGCGKSTFLRCLNRMNDTIEGARVVGQILLDDEDVYAPTMDVVELRKRYGKNLLMTGGIDKRAISAGGAAIDAELERKLPLAHEGGYVPTCDHSMPPDIPYASFCYYWEKKRELLGID